MDKQASWSVVKERNYQVRQKKKREMGKRCSKARLRLKGKEGSGYRLVHTAAVERGATVDDRERFSSRWSSIVDGGL